MEYLELKGRKYRFEKDFKHNPELRASFNALTQATYGFDFEFSYANGYWSDNYIPYSLLFDNEIVSNVSINLMEFLIDNEKKLGLQIGTVMTATDNRNQGLNRLLMEQVLKEWKDKCDFIYLFANDTVLDFYPKFNFERVEQYQCAKALHFSTNETAFRKLDMELLEDMQILKQNVTNTVHVAKISMQNNPSLIMFYSMSFMRQSIYYSEELEVVVVADIENETLILHDIYSKTPVDLNTVIQLFAGNSCKRVVLGFTPLDETGYEISLLKPDDVLFVLKEHSKLLNHKKWMFPVLSHA